jgi:hypothetical protein
VELHVIDEKPKLNELGKVDLREGVANGDVSNPSPIDDGLINLAPFSFGGFKNLWRNILKSSSI